jgi:hypothetical protein
MAKDIKNDKKEKTLIDKIELKTNQKKEKKEPEKKVEVVKKEEKKPEKEKVTESDEEFEEEYFDDDFEGGASPPSFSYPFMRRAGPPIRIQPISQQLEFGLEDISIPKKDEENNADQYKPTPEKNYSLGQKYEMAGGSSYASIAPKGIKAPPPTLGSDFNTPGVGMGFGNSSATPGYPGGESQERKYDSGLESQTRDQQRRRSM